MKWVQVMPADRLPPGERQVVEVEGREIVLANERGTVYAFDSLCPHMGAELEDAYIDAEGVITCPRHRSRFRLDTGEVIAWAPWPPVVGKVLGAVKAEHGLPVYPVRVSEGQISIGLPEEG